MRIFEFTEARPEHLLAVTDAGETLRYGAILDAERSFRALVGRNLVFLLCRNTPGMLLSYLGIMKSEAVPLLLDAATPAALLQELSLCYRPAFCVLPAERRAELAQLFSAAEEAGRIGDALILKTGWDGPALYDGLKLLLTTSGSTGSPKLVRLSAENLDANAEAIAEYLQITEHERPVTSLPMHYSYGMSVIHSHVLRGASLLLTERTIMERDFWDFAHRERATSFSGVPSTYELLDKLRFYDFAPSSLRTLTQAGGKLRRDLHEKLAAWCGETGRRFFVMYGQTEAAPRMGYLPFEDAARKPGSMGIAIPGGNLYLLDEKGNEISQRGQAGELVYAGANVSLGYAQCREDLLLGDENRGVLKTGDMAYQDNEGYFYITGRKSRFIKLLGRRCNLDELEQKLRGELGLEAACCGEDEALRVLIENMTREQYTLAREYLADQIRLPLPRIAIHGIDRIPKSPSGKILYGELANNTANIIAGRNDVVLRSEKRE